jgi:lysophospholipase L1-like esterase
LGDRFRIADGINAIDLARLLPWLREYLDDVEDYWERGVGSKPPTKGLINHNLAVYGWDLRNTLARSADIAKHVIQSNPSRDNLVRQVPEHANEIATLWVLNTARDAAGTALAPLQAAAQLSQEGDGIETLIILIGSNNALGSILTFRVAWSGEDYMNMAENDKYTVWIPSHFRAELDRLVEQVKQIRARRVIWGNVPHVTIAPFAKGLGKKVRPGSRYYPYYAPFWFKAENFNSRRHPNLTENQARAIDSVIDQYNNAIAEVVRQGRQEQRDWYLFETVALLDRLAQRRYIEDPTSRPDWWTEYPLPSALAALKPQPTSEFYLSNAHGRQQGGLFSLDGIHPTTIGYGILAQELINVMQLAGVKFYAADGQTERSGPIQIDFDRLIREDSLISNPPAAVAATIDFVGWLDSSTGIVSQIYTSNI